MQFNDILNSILYNRYTLSMSDESKSNGVDHSPHKANIRDISENCT